MHLKSLSVIDFKNLEQAEIQFSPKLNCFLGDNGSGKTNLLDAVYYLSFTKSYFNALDTANIRHGCDFFMLQAKFDRAGEEDSVACGFKNGQKKQFKRNSKVYKKLSEHIGFYPLVMISPADQILVLGGSDERRKFMDSVISQYDRQYLETLISYNRVLQQRNMLLKQFAENRTFDQVTLSVYDDQLTALAQPIFQKRSDFIRQLIPVFQNYYTMVSGGKEEVSLEYQSDLHENEFGALLESLWPKDRALQFTSAGIHKDDLQLKLGEHPIKKLGSQGQTKTYLVALKLAQFNFLKEISGVNPILLLDDIFDKLDAKRVSAIVKLVSDDHFGQIFITDTNREHLDEIVNELHSDFKIFTIDQGLILQS
jgi:DNA replication and repair protein RecF